MLAGLHAQNQLESATPTDTVVRDAIANAVHAIDTQVGAGHPPSMLNMVLSNGRAMYALRRGGPFAYVQRTGLSEPMDPEEERPRPGSPALRYVMLVAGGQDVPAGYVSMAENTLTVVGHDLDVHALPL